MTIKYKLFAVLALLLLSSASFAEEQSNFYLGFGTGVSIAKLDDSSTSTTAFLRGSGYDFILGYELGKYAAIEMEYVDRRVSNSDDTVNMIFSGGGVSAVILLPVTNTFSFFGKVGVASLNQTKPSFDSKNGASFGLGAQWTLTPKVKVRLAANSYDASASAGVYTGRVSALGAAVLVNF